MTRAKLEILVVLVLVAAIGVIGFKYYSKSSPAKVDACISTASEECPSADFLKDYDGWHALKEDINEISREKDLQAKQDRLTGWANRLNQQIPPGYTFNESTRKFDKRIVALPPQQTEPKK